MNILKSLVTLVFSILFSATLFSQKFPIEFGKINEKDLSMTVYDKDSSASAVILCDFGDTRLNDNAFKYNFDMIYYRHIRIKIFKADREVMEYFANFEIPYRKKIGGGQDKITDLKATTYNLENGKVRETNMLKSDIFDKEQFKYFFIKKIAIPDVKDGSIIDLTYTITSDYIYSPKTWYFQHSFPTIWSEYRFSSDTYVHYALNKEGFNPLSVSEKGKTLNTVNDYRWVMEHVPALRSEPYITRASDYYDKIEFQLKSTNFPGVPYKSFSNNWSEFVKDLIKEGDLGTKLTKRSAVEDLVKTIIEGKTTEKEKIVAITNYVKANINVKIEGGILSDRTHKKVLEEKVGTVGDVNLLLGAMLAESGIKVKPVLLSTRKHGRVAMNYPLFERFNYVIMQAQIDINYMLLDAAQPLMPIGVLPFELLNGQGLLLDMDNYRWIDLQATKMTDLVVANVIIDSKNAASGDKILKGTVNTTQKSYKGYENRKKIIEEGEEKYAKMMLERLVGNGALKSHAFTNVKNPEESLKGKFEFETIEFMDVNNEHIYFSPMLSFGWSDNPFKKPERLFPIDFAHPFDELYDISLKIPAGYIVEELPKPIKVQWQDGSFSFQYVVVPMNEQGILKINSKIQIKKPIFSAADYTDLKETFDQIIAKHAEQIVLKKQAK